jgi:hypothetical protein
VKLVSRLVSERGNALIEGVGFGLMAFVLLLSSGISLFEQQLSYLELQSLARNVLRAHQIHPEINYFQALSIFQSESELFKDQTLTLSYVCEPNCASTTSIVQLVITAENVRAEVFGVNN